MTLNKKGAVSRNTTIGLSVALFSAFVVYGVYTSYNNSPAYNPARRALFTGEGQNFGSNSFDSGTVSLQTSDGIPEDMRADYGEFGKTSGTGSVQNQIRENEAEFENARAYLEAQKAGTGSAQSGAVAVSSSEGGQETNPMLTPQSGLRNSYETAGAGTSDSTAGYIAGVISGSGEKDKDGKSKPEMAADKKGATVINKLAVSNGSSFGGAKGGSSSGGAAASAGSSMGGGSSRSGQDNSARSLPSANISGTADGSVFKAGRGGTMGGFSVAQGSSGVESGGTRGGGDSTKGELNKAHFYSGRAKQSLYSAGGKNMASAASDAAAAFDGSKGNEGGARIAGDNVVGSDPRNLASYKQLRGNFKKIEDNTEDDTDEQNTLADAGTIHMLKAIPIALAAMVCICGLKKAAVTGGPYAWLYYIAIAVIAFAALYAIWGADYDGNGHDILKDMSDLWAVNDRLGNHKQIESWSLWIPYVILPVLTGGIIAAAIWGQKLNFEGSGVGKKVMSMAEGKMTNEIVKQTTEEITDK